MSVLAWIGLGLVAGLLAKMIHPGKDPGGLIVTILLGIVGAVVGGYIGTLLGWGTVTEFDIKSLALAVGGGVLVLFLYRILIQRT